MPYHILALFFFIKSQVHPYSTCLLSRCFFFFSFWALYPVHLPVECWVKQWRRFLSAILVRIPWKITKLPSQHSMLGHHRPDSKTQVIWSFAGHGPLIVVFGSSLPSSTKRKKENVVKVGPLWQNFLDPRRYPSNQARGLNLSLRLHLQSNLIGQSWTEMSEKRASIG